MHVLLDLYGVLLEHEKTFRGYRERLAALLAARFGGEAEAWRRAHDEAFVTYTRRANEADWDARAYGDVVDELDARHLQEMFERVGVPPATGDPLRLSRELEREALAQVNARFPDARSAIERLRRMGHRVYVATGGSETNEAALRGAGLAGLIDGIFSGHSQGVHKSRPTYWSEVPRTIGARPWTASWSTIASTTSRPRPRWGSLHCSSTAREPTARRPCLPTSRRPCETSRACRNGS